MNESIFSYPILCHHYIFPYDYSFRATEPDDLIAMQQKEWDPVIKWFNER